MTGFRHDPLADVNLIADNLRDRYRNGFSVFKELVQNADDAGATAIEFALLDGIAGAINPLLHGPALVCVNDGVFRNEHARAIVHMGLGSKAAEQEAIGKFGLGQKAVFLLCETFLFLASPGDEPEDTKFPRANVVDPWADDEGDPVFPNWNAFPPSDRERITSAVSSIIGDMERWFLLWLPLRSAAHRRTGLGVIVDHEPSPDRLAAELRQVADFAELLPFLQNVRSIRFRRWRQEGLPTLPESSVMLEGEAPRLERGDHRPGRCLVLRGSIRAYLSGEPVRRLVFAGPAEDLQNPIFQDLKQNRRWPRSYIRKSATGKEEAAADKASAQAGVVLLRSPRLSADGKLSIRWAVYLPVGEETGPAVRMPLAADYALLLHGCYFLDAGRQRIDGLEEPAGRSGPTDEAALRLEWNARLRDLGTLALVPQALAYLQDTHRPPRDEITALCRAIRASEIFRNHGAAIAGRHSFVSRASPRGMVWQLV